MQDKRDKRDRRSGPRLNDNIRISECRLVGGDGHIYGVMSMSEARNIAKEQDLDLIEISPNSKPPVVKLIDYGKFKYEQQKKAKEAKKKQVIVQLKEIQFKPNIETHDLETKLRNAARFLDQGDKIKMVMQFRGREMAYKDLGMEKFLNILKKIEDMGATVESIPKFMGNRIITIVASNKKPLSKAAKLEAKAEKSKDKDS